MATLLQELYTAPGKFTRIQAMLYSVGLALDESLIATLRVIAEKSDDKLERAVAWYVIAYTTMIPDDIEAFLSAYLYDGQTVEGMFEARYQLRTGGGELELRYFLYQLAIIPDHRHKALIALIADNCYQIDFGITDYNNFSLGSIPEDVIISGKAFHDDSQHYLKQMKEYDVTPVADRFLMLLDSSEMESRVALYRIAYKMDFFKLNICARLTSKLSAEQLSQEETTMLLFSMSDILFCGNRNLSGEEPQEGEITITQAFYKNLPDNGPAMCKLLLLESLTSSKKEVADLIIGNQTPPLSVYTRNKLEALLECDPALIGLDRVGKIHMILGK